MEHPTGSHPSSSHTDTLACTLRPLALPQISLPPQKLKPHIPVVTHTIYINGHNSHSQGLEPRASQCVLLWLNLSTWWQLCVRGPPLKPDLHPFWHFLPLERTLCHIIRSSRLKMTQTALHWRGVVDVNPWYQKVYILCLDALPRAVTRKRLQEKKYENMTLYHSYNILMHTD